jgi:hypothetical protein
MKFKNIAKIPEIDSYSYYRIQRKLALLIKEKRAEKEELNLEQVSLEQKDKKQKSSFYEYSPEYITKSLNTILKKRLDYSFGRAKVSGRFVCKEKNALRVITNARTLSIINREDKDKFLKISNQNKLALNFKKTLQEFNVLKTFENLKTEIAILSNTNTRIKFRFQSIQELERNYIRIRVRPKRWINNKGMIGETLQGFIFVPYSKTPFRFKNKKDHFGKYPTRLKEDHYEPAPTGLLRFFLLADIKRQIWLIQTKKLHRNLEVLGIVHRYKYPYAFIIGVNGVPVLLHRNQLFFSCRQMKQASGIFKFRSLFVFKVFAKYKSEKRTNVQIEKLLKFSKKNNLFKLLKFLKFNI